MEIKSGLHIRPAIQADQQQIAALIHTGTHVHRHLDWRSPMDWIGFPPYLVAEQAGRLVAALACPPDPPKVAWLRLFVHADWLPLGEAWQSLWCVACSELGSESGYLVGAIALHGWLEDLLRASDFITRQQIVMLEWNCPSYVPSGSRAGVLIRPMTLSDLPEVANVDAAAFKALWQISFSTLTRSFPQVVLTTVAESAGQVIGYQLSTRNPYGIHLARLAVRPDAQDKKIGLALVENLILQATQRNIRRITVNTQSDNHASLKLYHRLGFRLTGERYPVYEFKV